MAISTRRQQFSQTTIGDQVVEIVEIILPLTACTATQAAKSSLKSLIKHKPRNSRRYTTVHGSVSFLDPEVVDRPLILAGTAARTSEVLRATWNEVDLEQQVWIIPAERMKARREHRVPLSNPAHNLLKSLPREEGWRRPQRECGR